MQYPFRAQCWCHITEQSNYAISLDSSACRNRSNPHMTYMWMLRLVSLLISCYWHLLACKAIAADSSPDLGASQAMTGPCSPISSYEIPKITVGGITLTSGVITVPECNSLDTIGLLLFHSGFAVRCFCVLAILKKLLIFTTIVLT